MKKFATAWGVVFLVLSAVIYRYGGSHLQEFYVQNLRVPFFGGFLTVGSFLLSLKTTILLRLKEDLYDKESYRRIWLGRRGLGCTDSYYGPLERLGKLLIWCVGISYLASAWQLTLGLLPYQWAAAIGAALAGTALGLAINCWAMVSLNLSFWFQAINQEAVRKA